MFGQVRQSLIVVSNCMPASPHTCALSAIMRISSHPLCVSTTRPSVTARVSHSPSSATARMKPSGTRTELFRTKMEL